MEKDTGDIVKIPNKMTTILASIGAIVVGAVLLIGLFYAYAFISWVWYWRFGKGAKSLGGPQK